MWKPSLHEILHVGATSAGRLLGRLVAGDDRCFEVDSSKVGQDGIGLNKEYAGLVTEGIPFDMDTYPQGRVVGILPAGSPSTVMKHRRSSNLKVEA